MSYASVAGAGQEQTLEQKCAPVPTEIENQEPVARVASVNVDTTSVHTVQSDFKSQPILTETQENPLKDELELKDIETWFAQERPENAGEKNDARGNKSTSHVDGFSKDYVSLFNTVTAIALCSGLSFGTYRKYIAGELDWKFVGVWTGIVGAFAITNFHLTKFFDSQFRTEEKD